MRSSPKEFRIASLLSKLPCIVPCRCYRWNQFKSSLARSQYSFTFQQVMRPVYISISSCRSLRIGEKCRAQRSIGSSEGLGPQFRTSGFSNYEKLARLNHYQHHFCGILSSSVLDVDAIMTPSGIARSSIRAMGTSSVESITIEMKYDH
jgi:hypothetical protein